MAKLSDVLLVIDLQNGVCFGDGTIDGLDAVVKTVNGRIDAYTKANRPVIFVQHTNDRVMPSGSEAWKIIPALHTGHATARVNKTHANSFYHTELKAVLDSLNVQSIEIYGAQTEYCVDTTIKFAHGLGYTLSMVPGATTTYGNRYMTAQETVNFYERIWDKRFLTIMEVPT